MDIMMKIVYVIYSFNSLGEQKLLEVWSNELDVSQRMSELHDEARFGSFAVVPYILREYNAVPSEQTVPGTNTKFYAVLPDSQGRTLVDPLY